MEQSNTKALIDYANDNYNPGDSIKGLSESNHYEIAPNPNFRQQEGYNNILVDVKAKDAWGEDEIRAIKVYEAKNKYTESRWAIKQAR